MYGLYQIVVFTIIDILNTLKSPFFIGIIFIIYFQYYKIGQKEKEIIGYRRNTFLKLFRSIVFGIFGGIITTVLFLYLGVVVIPKDFMYILVAAILLSFINPRYMCFSYGGGLISLISLTLGFPKIQISQIMSVVAVLHIVESILIFLDGAQDKLPFFFQGEKDIVGGFNMNRFWPIPFVVFMGDGLIQPITLMAILNYGEYSISSYPGRKTMNTSIILFIYSIILLLMSKMTMNPFIPPIFAILGHEFIILRNKKKEDEGFYIFSPPKKGVKILEILPNSIGQEIGIGTGDILLKINEVDVNSRKDLEDIMRLGPASMKIELFNIKLGLVIKRYNGKGKPLGLVIVPRGF